MASMRHLRVVERGEPDLELGDVLDQDALALELLTGGEGARRRAVAGAHSIELDRPTSWLGPGWIMLTAGVRLRGNAKAQRELVAELDEAGAAALGFGCELVFKQPPAALLDEARVRGFPVFSVPLRTPFREIVTTITRSLISSDLRTYQRLSSMQLYLLDALREGDPRLAVAERVAELLRAGVAILSPSGVAALAVGEPPVTAIWETIADRPVALHEVDADGWHAVAAPVLGPADQALEWLVVATRGSAFANPLTKPVAQAAAPLLAATARLGAVERSQEQAIRASLLDELLRPARARDLPALAARAATLGIDFAEPARVVLVQHSSDVSDALAASLDDAHIPHLVSRRGQAIAILAQGHRAELRARLDVVSEEHASLTAGIGRPSPDAAGLRHSLRDAQLALARVALDEDARVLDYEDFELGLLLLSEAPPERVQAKIDDWTALLRARPMLWEAVSAYFTHDLDVARTASALHLHPNSLRYRLTRVEKLLGRSLKQPSTIAAIYVGMLATSDQGGPSAAGPAGPD